MQEPARNRGDYAALVGKLDFTNPVLRKFRPAMFIDTGNPITDVQVKGSWLHVRSHGRKTYWFKKRLPNSNYYVIAYYADTVVLGIKNKLQHRWI